MNITGKQELSSIITKWDLLIALWYEYIGLFVLYDVAYEIASARSPVLMQPNMSLNATWNGRNLTAYTIGFIPLFKPNNIETI